MTASPQPGKQDERCRCGLPRSSPVHGNPFGAGHRYEPEPAAAADQPGEPMNGSSVHDQPGAGEEADQLTAAWDEGWHQPAPSAGQDTGQALRDEGLHADIVQTIYRVQLARGIGMGHVGRSAITDALLDGPLRQLIDQRDQARAQVQRVRAAIDELEADDHEPGFYPDPDYWAGLSTATDRLRRALDGPA